MKDNGISHVLKAGKIQELVYELKVEQAMTKKIITVKPVPFVERGIMVERKRKQTRSIHQDLET